ncbi:glycosyltransferase family 4 protein [Xiamenia xianingshaonis]|uniref:Glycosyl transferase family 4 n=1 Tax=Xiamenia xianingshaonis TaxID=2682776 RepID=A0A9E6MRP1_9ACTN|nr:MraY family glycosyltransferase [Xiamenia xianingshaonis]NHM14808.1 glycosyl transferase family 4 [Xiamenia xianingshaonis]NHM16836.1 glycosyl transferase family 4 [Xiamenia xianingshaonis]QTU84785.1 undecaprenyl/decaprenyl-phosphate alpha-N-acetylglucosaminyl 1-phosphate transferase [Xiamenia xianingshaonis]
MEWYQPVIVFCVAFVVTYCMVPVSKRIAKALGAIDYPGNRRVNRQPIPRCGGIALYAGMAAACFMVLVGVRCLGWTFEDYYVLEGIDYPLLFVGVTFVFTVGLVDDVTQLSALVKLAGQIMGAVIIVAAGVSIGGVRSIIEGNYVALGWVDWPLTVAYLVVFINITNLIDGLDGLAAGLIAIVSTAFLYLVWVRGSYLLMFACIALIACCLAFLRFNFFPASIFMGDSGSHLLGLLVGIVSVVGVVRTQGFVVMLVPLVIAGVPAIDTVSAFIRRLRGHQSPGRADMGHVHHRLMRAGLSQKRAVAVLWLSSAALAFVGCMMVGLSGPTRWSLFGVLAVVIFFVIWRFGLFRPVLKHHYDNRDKRGPRLPRDQR